MSGILGLLFLALPFIYWGVIPLAAVALVAWLWRRAHAKGARGAVLLLAVIGGMWLAWVLGEGEKRLADAKVRELCAKDGGVKVYEQVKLPAEKYDEYTRRNWILPDKIQAKSTDEYYSESETYFYRKSDPQVARTVTRIIRRSDGKVLGEYIHYGRGGGDLPGPWHGSSFLCPDPTKSTGFETKIFIKGE